MASWTYSNKTVKDYNTKFESLIIKGDLGEAGEQTIAMYFFRSQLEIPKVVDLLPYHSLGDIMKLALKVETQN